MGYLVKWDVTGGHITQGKGATITRNQNIDVCTKVQLPRSVMSGCTEIRKPGNPISRISSTWRESGVNLICSLGQKVSETGGRVGKPAQGHLLP